MLVGYDMGIYIKFKKAKGLVGHVTTGEKAGYYLKQGKNLIGKVKVVDCEFGLLECGRLM